MVLTNEREAALRLKGENGVMRKKFVDLNNKILQQVEEQELQHGPPKYAAAFRGLSFYLTPQP